MNLIDYEFNALRERRDSFNVTYDCIPKIAILKAVESTVAYEMKNQET